MNKNNAKAKPDKHRNEDVKTVPVFVKYGIIALAAIIAIAIGLVIAFNVSGGYVAKVGDEKITTGEFKYYLEYQKKSMLENARLVDPNTDEATFWSTKISGEDAIEFAKRQSLEALRDLKIQLIKAKAAGTELTKDEIKKNIDDNIQQVIIEQYGEGNKIRANQKMKSEYGITIDELRQMQIEQYTIAKYKDAEAKKISVTDEEIKKAYEENPSAYDKVTVRHILFLFTGSEGKRTKEESRKLANETLAKIRAGEDMAALAEKLSEDSGVKDNKGIYEISKETELQYVKEFQDWAMKAAEGDTAVVESTSSGSYEGFHVMKAEKREARSLDTVKDQIKTSITGNKFSADYTAKMEKWRTEFNIEKNQKVYDSIK